MTHAIAWFLLVMIVAFLGIALEKLKKHMNHEDD